MGRNRAVTENCGMMQRKSETEVVRAISPTGLGTSGTKIVTKSTNQNAVNCRATARSRSGSKAEATVQDGPAVVVATTRPALLTALTTACASRLIAPSCRS